MEYEDQEASIKDEEEEEEENTSTTTNAPPSHIQKKHQESQILRNKELE